jgi:hypothetical protein
MRLSDEDARQVAEHVANEAVDTIDAMIVDLDQEEWERLGDDLAEGFRRVLVAAEIVPSSWPL